MANEAERREYLAEYKRRMGGSELDPNKMKRNDGLRSVAKLLLNVSRCIAGRYWQ